MVGPRRYEILGPLGKGGFGTVYKARYLGEGGFEKLVAVKILNADKEGVEELAVRLRDEARMLGRLRHRAIVGVDRLTQLGGRWAVVMEYVEGVSLEAVLKHGPISAGVALDIISEVASGLAVAAATRDREENLFGLQHRDIKPSNVQVTPHGEVKLLDFGIARAEFVQREAVTHSVHFGTPMYMAPERFMGNDLPAGDIYALGAVLFEMVVGRRLGSTAFDKAMHSSLREAALERMEAAEVPSEVAALVLQMIAWSPTERPDAQEVVRQCHNLRRRMEEEALQFWCARAIPAILGAQRSLSPDALVGSVLVESAVTSAPTSLEAPEPRREGPPISSAAPPATETTEGSTPTLWIAIGFLCIFLVGVGGLVGVASYVRSSRQSLLDLASVEPPPEFVPTPEIAAPSPSPGPTASAERQDALEGVVPATSSGAPAGTARSAAPARTEDSRTSTTPPTSKAGQTSGGSRSTTSTTPVAPPSTATSSSRTGGCARIRLGTGGIAGLRLEGTGGTTGKYRITSGGTMVPKGDYVFKLLLSDGDAERSAGKITVVCSTNVAVTCDTVFKRCEAEPE